MRRRDEHGGGTVLTAGVCASLVVVAWCSCALVAWLGQISSAQDAADFAALAAAGAQARGQDPCVAARTAASHNRSDLIGCSVQGDHRSFVVEVRVARVLEPRVPGAPPRVERIASAGSVQ